MPTVEPELKLKQFLYLCSENAKYTATNKISYDFCQLSNVQSVFELITADKENMILELIENANNDPVCVRRETLLFVLAVCTRNGKTDKFKTAAYDAVLKVCKNTEELFLFIKFAHMLNKNFSHGFKRIIRNYYLKVEALELQRIVTQSNSYFGWTHKDIFKQVHVKSSNAAQEVLITYVMKNFQEAKKVVEEIGQTENTSLIHDIIRNLEKLDTIKHCQDEKQALNLMKESHFQIQQLPSNLLKSQMVWESLIPTLEIPALLAELGRLNRLGLLKHNNPTLNKVVEVLADTKKCHACKIQPAQVFMYLKIFERGKPVDPQKRAYIISLENKEGVDSEAKKKDLINLSNPPKNNTIISVLYKLLQHSFKNVHCTGRRVMVTLDVRDVYMKHFCFPNKTVTCMEAAVLIALSFIKAEKDVTVGVFNDSEITVVPFEKGMTYAQALQKLKETTGGYVILNNTMNWSIENKKPIDVFVNLLYSPDSLQRVPKKNKNPENPVAALKRYRQKMHLPNTKMITVSLGSRKLVVADGSPHILDVCGFDHNVPKVIEACCKGVLQ